MRVLVIRLPGHLPGRDLAGEGKTDVNNGDIVMTRHGLVRGDADGLFTGLRFGKDPRIDELHGDDVPGRIGFKILADDSLEPSNRRHTIMLCVLIVIDRELHDEQINLPF